ncbi:hypothetical protein TNIN_97771 [Trichonephila inaurata madagascariensis]|uniref:Uncharacterized protein n=1 Tax=Trichonephila inaurata madagascariensis TaxID=2747483 RepID=A0A8X6IW50_9ARAC|nr:hypothetical protein TNIN_97771 [Trichonephila inaurata madagascariensis]
MEDASRSSVAWASPLGSCIEAPDLINTHRCKKPSDTQREGKHELEWPTNTQIGGFHPHAAKYECYISRQPTERSHEESRHYERANQESISFDVTRAHDPIIHGDC